MLEFQHVTFQYDSEDFNIIDDLSFTVEPEEFISIIGISGCGKSTIYAPEGSALSMAHH